MDIAAILNKKKNGDRTEYQHQYYLKNRERILQARKERYRKQKESNNGSKIVSSEVQTENI